MEESNCPDRFALPRGEGHSPGVPVDGNAERASDSELG